DSRDGESQMGEHATRSRDFDESLRGFREALMVASEAAPAGDPGKGSFHHPSPGLDLKASGARLGFWLGLRRTGIWSRAQATHGLNIPPEMLFSPLKKLSPVSTITPNQLETGKASVQWLKHLLASS